MGLFDGTELERPVICGQCGKDSKVCNCVPLSPSDIEVEPAKQQLKLRLEKRKRGKLVTVIGGVLGSTNQRQSLLTDLKNHCGAGGTQVDESIEIQGDHVLRIENFLRAKGFRVAKR